MSIDTPDADIPRGMPVVDRGPWTAKKRENDGKWCVESDDFEHDAQLIIYGDFADDEQRKAYAEGIAAQLNAGMTDTPYTSP